jgi:hypothetical protein
LFDGHKNNLNLIYVFFFFSGGGTTTKNAFSGGQIAAVWL